MESKMSAGTRCLIHVLLLSVATTTGVTALTYTCFPDNKITVDGFTAGNSDIFYAVQDGSLCSVTKSGTAIDITNCSKNKDILVTYGSYGNMVNYSVHAGSGVKAFKVSCTELAATGVAHTITNAFTASLSIDESQTTQPSYSVSSSLSAASTTVGNSVTLSITFPSSYSMEVTSCTAYPGNDASSTSEAISLTAANGCTDASDLISDFTILGDSGSATITAFKFYDNSNVFIKCSVKICPSGSNACTQACSLRKRRSDRMFNTSELANSNDYLTRETHNVLRVTDPFENNAVTVAPIGWMSLLALAVVLRTV